MVTGISFEQFNKALDHINNDYDGNIQVKDYSIKSGNRFSVSTRVRDTSGKGSRRAASGRKTMSLCWHGHRDLYRAIFSMNESARIKTMLANYKGKENFEETYPETKNINVGSVFMPAYANELCDCRS